MSKMTKAELADTASWNDFGSINQMRTSALHRDCKRSLTHSLALIELFVYVCVCARSKERKNWWKAGCNPRAARRVLF